MKYKDLLGFEFTFIVFIDDGMKITDLLRGAKVDGDTGVRKKLRWTEDAEKAMRALIGKITSYPVPRFPIHDINHPFTLTTNASSIAAAGALWQVQGEDNEYPISFCSKRLDETQGCWGELRD